jgi:hypothetical protein
MKMCRTILSLFSSILLILFFSCSDSKIDNLNEFISKHDGNGVLIAYIDTGIDPLIQNIYSERIIYLYDATKDIEKFKNTVSELSYVELLNYN